MRRLLGCGLLIATVLLAGCSASPEASCKLIWRADVPIEPRDDLILVGATFDNQPATMVMDTGAERTMLVEAAVTRMRLRRDLRHATNTIGIGGTSASYEAMLDAFSVGPFKLPVERVAVGTFQLPEIGGVPPDGLLGADILLAFDLDIDLPGRRLTIYRARTCADAVPPWTVPYASVDGVGMRRDRLVVPLSINGAEGHAVLDTGAQRSVISPAFAARAGVTQAMLDADPSRMMRGASREPVSFHLHRFATIRVGTDTSHGVVLPVVPLPGGAEDALIGEDFLRGRRIWLSFASHQVFFTTPQAFTLPSDDASPVSLPPAAQPQPQAGQRVEPHASQIPVRNQGGAFVVPVTINNGPTLPFVIGSGVSEVSIPANAVAMLMRTGIVQAPDFLGTQQIRFVDGSTVPSATFRLRVLKLGDREVENVIASVTNPGGNLLLGQSFLLRFKSWSIDNQRQMLLLN